LVRTQSPQASSVVIPLTLKAYVDAAIAAIKKSPVKFQGAACFASVGSLLFDPSSVSFVAVTDNIVCGTFIFAVKTNYTYTGTHSACILASTIPAPIYPFAFPVLQTNTPGNGGSIMNLRCTISTNKQIGIYGDNTPISANEVFEGSFSYIAAPPPPG
jgi:hypothetical protein